MSKCDSWLQIVPRLFLDRNTETKGKKRAIEVSLRKTEVRF